MQQIFELNRIAIDIVNEYGWTALMYAAKHNHAAIAPWLLQIEVLNMLYTTHKININEQDNQGCNALMYAHDPEIIQILLSWGVDSVLQNKKHQTALQFRMQECGRNKDCSLGNEIIAVLKHFEEIHL